MTIQIMPYAKYKDGELVYQFGKYFYRSTLDSLYKQIAALHIGTQRIIIILFIIQIKQPFT